MVTDKKTRIQIDLKAEEAIELDRMRDQFGLKSRADTVRTALAIAEWIESESKLGRKVLSVDQEYVSHLVVPGITTSFGK